MTTELLIEPIELQELIQSDACLVFDCRFDLQHTEAGRNSWLASHIPGAVYAHLDDDLASPVTQMTGRHPLPSPAAFADFLGRSGWVPGKRVVAYDGGPGFIASRLWWLLRYFGLAGGSVLNGGFAAWIDAALPLEPGETAVKRSPAPVLEPRADCVMGAAEIDVALQQADIVLLDARNGARFRGEMEPLDSAAGHIPGARNHPCDLNIGPNKRFREVKELRAALGRFAGDDELKPVVHMCGSGVTACHNLLAMELAGFTHNKLYVGSWSEWICDPDRPIATGDD